MLKYLIVLLDDTSTSFCHYPVSRTERRLISPEDLQKAILFGMKENLMIQFVYPDYPLPADHEHLIRTVDHVDIKPIRCADPEAVCVVDAADIDTCLSGEYARTTLVVRGTVADLCLNRQSLKKLIHSCTRVNVAITDLTKLTEPDIEAYTALLADVADSVVEQTQEGSPLPQVNILTDRIMLDHMNNCGAGSESLTVGPDGRFYACPGFFHDSRTDIDASDTIPQVSNQALYTLEKAPICRRCDAYQCHRCVWASRHLTLEVNTPGHRQCVISHIERNASRSLLKKIQEKFDILTDKDIPAIDYTDPFEKITK